MSTRTDWTILRVNQTMAELTGYAAAELVGRPFSALLSVAGRIYHETHYAPLIMLQGAVRGVAAELVRADRRRLPVLLGSRLRVRDGVTVIRTSVLDATDRRRYEEELLLERRRAESSEAQARLLHALLAAVAAAHTLEELSNALEVVPASGWLPCLRCELWTPTASGRLIAVASPSPEEIDPKADHPVARAWRDGGIEAAGDELIAVRADSEGHELGVVALRRPAGAPALTGEQRELVQTLGRELGQAIQRFRLHEKKDWLIGMAAHDLRNPLASVMGFAQLLEHRAGPSLDPPDRAMLARIVSASRNMNALIDDLLSLSVIESGALQLERRRLDVRPIVAECIEARTRSAADKGITVTRTDRTESGEAYVDPARIAQVIDNLLSNAIKYSESGSTVDLRVVDAPRALLIEVSDTGQGIPVDEQPSLFGAFQRTSARPTGGESSTGLGLAITKSIVDAHGGDIGVESAVGEGTTFRVRLPVEPPDPAA